MDNNESPAGSYLQVAALILGIIEAIATIITAAIYCTNIGYYFNLLALLGILLGGCILETLTAIPLYVFGGIAENIESVSNTLASLNSQIQKLNEPTTAQLNEISHALTKTIPTCLNSIYQAIPQITPQPADNTLINTSPTPAPTTSKPAAESITAPMPQPEPQSTSPGSIGSNAPITTPPTPQPIQQTPSSNSPTEIKCPVCGTYNNANAYRCFHCTEPLHRCPHCGSAHLADEQTCPSCGKSLSKSPVTPQNPQSDLHLTQQSASPNSPTRIKCPVCGTYNKASYNRCYHCTTPLHHCPRCGAAHHADEKICPSCGKPLSEPPTPPSPSRPAQSPSTPKPSAELASILDDLAALHDMGILTDEEYQQKKSAAESSR